jgi:pyruvate/2-oxoglutarate dehydrogenase complex dihydrolipoamide dehydrogenase (E3) component
MLIGTGTRRSDSLAGRVAIVTGGGGGIGFETSRALLWLGASVTIAEIDADMGKSAIDRLRDEFADPPLLFVQTDVSVSVSSAAGNPKSIGWRLHWSDRLGASPRSSGIGAPRRVLE